MEIIDTISAVPSFWATPVEMWHLFVAGGIILFQDLIARGVVKLIGLILLIRRN